MFLRRDVLEGEGLGKMFRDIVCDPVQAVGIISGGGGGFPGGETAVGGGQNLVQSVFKISFSILATASSRRSMEISPLSTA